jgi:hypothetical protein
MTWQYINTRAEDKIPALADQLAALLKAERGGKWLRSDSIRVALEEAIKARTNGSMNETVIDTTMEVNTGKGGV